MAKSRRHRGPKKQWRVVETATQSVHFVPPRQHPYPLDTTRPLPSQPLSRPTLNDRFQALPPEIRAHIFSLLLVRHVKWDLPHEPSCPCLTNDYNPDLVADYHNYTCARCFRWYPSSWRVNTKKQWINPYRSQWAAPIQNPYVCSDCWDACLRPRPFPETTSRLPCLCPRRQNLEIFLVCRQWYEEAGHLFWTRNTFAFDDCNLFVDFVDNIPCTHRNKITRVSIMSTDQETNKQLAKFWSRLRSTLLSLRSLELDAKFLSSMIVVPHMLRLGLRNIRQVRFTLRHPDSLANTLNNKIYVYPAFCHPYLLQGGLAEEVARAIKGERRRWMKDLGLLYGAVQWEHRRQRRVESSDNADRGAVIGWSCARRVDEIHDLKDDYMYCDVVDNPLQETTILRRGHWRSWTPSVVGALQNAEREDEAARLGEYLNDVANEEEAMCQEQSTDDDIHDPFQRMLRL